MRRQLQLPFAPEAPLADPRSEARIREHASEADELPTLPLTRGECATVPRPCPFVSCRHHLLLEVDERAGGITRRHGDAEPDELPAARSCVLDIADRGGVTLEEVGEAIGLTRERVRQIELAALGKIGRRLPLLGE